VDNRRTWTATLFSFVLLLATLFAGPVAAHHKAGHAQGGSAPEHSNAEASSSHSQGGEPDGDADSDSGTAYTEDNDTNDGSTPNNEPDEGDNAHPSGKDRSVEAGNSGNQGNSESDPDDDGRGPERTNGGPDKPNGAGGVDLADQDGNNGCGNDDDFEDDNEGHCRGLRPPVQPPEVKPEDEVLDVTVTVDTILRDRVLSTVEPRSRAATVAVGAAGGGKGAPLPFTGWTIGPLLVVALASMVSGLLMLRSRRSR
jgi:hypothetical protein